MIRGEDKAPETSDAGSTLVTIEAVAPVTALDVFTKPEAGEPLMARIEEVARAFKGDVTTAKGRQEIASIAYRVARTKTYLDDMGKKLVADMKELPKAIDAQRKVFRDRLDTLKDDVRSDLTKWEQHQAHLEQSIEDLRFTPASFMDRTADQTAHRIEFLETSGPTLETWGELLPVAEQAIADALVILRDQLTNRQRYDAEQIELARLREEKEAREKADREEKIRQEAADKARAEAIARAQAELDASARREAEAKLAQERAERDRQDADRRLEQERADSAAREARVRQQEQERQEQERRAIAAEDAKRAADEEHRRKLNREALASLVLVIQQTTTPAGESGNDSIAKAVLTAVIKGLVPHVSIHY
jgi:hypothetical protein